MPQGRADDSEEGWKSSPYLLDTHTVVLMDEVGGLGFPKSLEVFVKKEGKRDRIQKLGNRTKVLFDKQRNGG